MFHPLLSVAVAALALLAAAPARADMAEDYARLRNDLGPMLFGLDFDADAAYTEKMIAAAEGGWYPVEVVAGGPGLPDADAVARVCAANRFVIAPVDKLSFQVRTADRQVGTLVTTYAYTGHGLFEASTPVSKYLERLFGDDLSKVPAQTWMLSLRLNQSRGPVTVLMPTHDLMVLIPLAGIAYIYGRCPSP